MRQRLQAVAFDLEGTIVDLESAHHRGHLDAAAEVGLHLSLEQAIKEIPAFVGGPDIEVAKAIQSRAERPVTIEHLLGRMKHFYRMHKMSLDVRVRPGFDRVLTEVEKLGILTCIGSVTNRDEGTELLRACGLASKFPRDRLVFAEDVIAPKPAPDVYQETAKRMRVKPSQQTVFEDSIPGIRAAVAAGSTVVAVPVLHQEEFLLRLLSAGASRVYSNWDEVDVSALLAD